MNKLYFTYILAVIFSISACNNSGPDKKPVEAQVTNPKQPEMDSAGAEAYLVDTNKSSFTWEGHKKIDIGDRHEGTVRLKQSEVFITGNTITGGSFLMDMNSIDNIDLRGKNEMQKKLINHLKSPDFFDVEKYPVSKFEITSVKDSAIGKNNAWVEGNLTIKNSTQNIGFPAQINVGDNKAAANARIVIDRSKFDVRYGSESFFKSLAGDKIISNDITLDINLIATKK